MALLKEPANCRLVFAAKGFAVTVHTCEDQFGPGVDVLRPVEVLLKEPGKVVDVPKTSRVIVMVASLGTGVELDIVKVIPAPLPLPRRKPLR